MSRAYVIHRRSAFGARAVQRQSYDLGNMVPCAYDPVTSTQ